MSAILVMARPQAFLAAGTASLLGSHLGGASRSGGRSWLAALTVLLIVACCNVVNDLVDVETDTLNRPDRALPAGRVGFRAAAVTASLLAAGGLSVARALGPGEAAVAGASFMAGVSYSLLLRRLPLLGHIWVAMLFGGTVIWGGWATSRISSAVWMAAVLVALFLLPRELLKSLGDDGGDLVSGWRTAAVIWGRRGTLVAISSTSVVFAAATLAPMLVGMGSGIYLGVISLGTTLPLLVVVAALWRRPNLELRRAEFLTGLMWLPGLAALWQLAPAG